MQLTVSDHTQQRLAKRMAARGFATLDEAINEMLDETDGAAGPPWLAGPPTDEELDAALDEADRTGGTPVAEVREQLRREFGLDHL